MGLDMYFYKANRKFKSNKEMHSYGKKVEGKEIKYFRKHSDLHGFIDENRDIWHKEKFPVLNCVEVLITKDLLHNIKRHAIKSLENFETMKHTNGFFFGESTKDDWVETIKMIDNILANVDFDKESIIYDCWW